MADNSTIEILYDGECPVCTNYCKKIEMKTDTGTLALLDAREKGALLEEVTKLGLDIDEGMVLKKDGKIFYGSEAMREIVKLKKAGEVERLIYRFKPVAAAVYGLCKAGRNVVLWFLAIDKIGNLK